MAYPTKIVTCCYCGVKAALVLKGTSRHELSCSSCGAPLHDLKMLPKAKKRGERELVRPSPVRHQKPIKRKKKRKARFADLIEDAFDFIEDILD